MKWTIPELRKLRSTGNKFSYVAAFDRFLSDEDDLVAISPVTVAGSFQILRDPEEFVFAVAVQCTLVMPCAITLADVDVPLAFETELTFSEAPADDNAIKIEGMTIDLDAYVFGEILIEKPMRVLAENAYEGYHDEITTFADDDGAEARNPFAGLKQPK